MHDLEFEKWKENISKTVRFLVTLVEKHSTKIDELKRQIKDIQNTEGKHCGGYK